MALQRSIGGLRAPSPSTLVALQSALASFRISPLPAARLPRVRQASHQAQGRANGAKDGPGKRLGAKKTGGEYVVPGNILFRQRGTLWFAGDGCFMGRDHTVHAAVPGYVQYYRDPARHPKRKYIGVVFDKADHLPQPPNAVRRRRLGMLAYQMPQTVEQFERGDAMSAAEITSQDADARDAGRSSTIQREAPKEERQTRIVKDLRNGKVVETKVTLRPGYQWRQANWEIGDAALKSRQATKVEPFKPRDRFAAWRKRSLRRVASAEKRAMGRGGKKKK